MLILYEQIKFPLGNPGGCFSSTLQGANVDRSQQRLNKHELPQVPVMLLAA